MCCSRWISRWWSDTESRLDPNAPEGNELRSRALADVARGRRLRFHLGAFLLGLIILGGPWVAINYMNAGGWPDRLSDKGRPGDWNPTVLTVLIVWALLLAIHGLKAYSHRPATETEIRRAAERLRQG
jgi:2TM domain